MSGALATIRLAALSLLTVAALPVGLAESRPKAPAAEQTHPHVSPRSGGRHTTFVLTLTVADDLGVRGVVQADYSIDVSNGGRNRCGSGFAENLNAGRRGQRLSIKLAPQARGWCRGRYRGVVLFERGPYCPKPSPGQPPRPCPEFPSQALDAGRFAFTVR
jgi:hypothetical protein